METYCSQCIFVFHDKDPRCRYCMRNPMSPFRKIEAADRFEARPAEQPQPINTNTNNPIGGFMPNSPPQPTITISPSSGGYVVVTLTNDPIPEIVNCPSVQILPKPITNGDRVRQMSNEELAKYYAENIKCHQCLIDHSCPELRSSNKCIARLTAWLNQIAEEQ